MATPLPRIYPTIFTLHFILWCPFQLAFHRIYPDLYFSLHCVVSVPTSISPHIPVTRLFTPPPPPPPSFYPLNFYPPSFYPLIFTPMLTHKLHCYSLWVKSRTLPQSTTFYPRKGRGSTFYPPPPSPLSTDID